jgi:hypothetical protein
VTDQAALDRFAAAVAAAHDPVGKLAEAVSAAWNHPAAQAAGGVVARMHAERQPDGVLLRITDAASGRSVEAVLDTAACQDLARYLAAR